MYIYIYTCIHVDMYMCQPYCHCSPPFFSNFWVNVHNILASAQGVEVDFTERPKASIFSVDLLMGNWPNGFWASRDQPWRLMMVNGG